MATSVKITPELEARFKIARVVLTKQQFKSAREFIDKVGNAALDKLNVPNNLEKNDK